MVTQRQKLAPLEIAKLLEHSARRIYKERGPRSIHPGQWAVLRFLASAKDHQKDLNGVAAHLGITPAPASRALAALEEKGLVIGEVRADDRRKRQMTLSPEGRSILENDPMLRLEKIIEALPEEHQNTLQSSLQTIFEKLETE